MQLIQVAAAVLNQTPLDWDGNQRRIVAAIEAARAAGASLVCLPELCISGYGCEDAFHAPALQATAQQILQELEPRTTGMIVSVGLPWSFQRGLFNVAALLVDGRLVGLAAKRFLAGDGIHYEPRWFKPWPAGQQATVAWRGREIPLGDVHFDCGGVKIGFEICEDAWVANRPGAELALRGVDVILNPSASHFAFGKHEVRRRFVLEGSRAFNVSYVYSNLVGNESGRAIYDGGALIAASGRLLAEGPRFSFQDFLLTTAQVDVDDTRMKQARTGSFEPDLERRAGCVVVPFNFPRVELAPPVASFPSWESGPTIKEEEFARAESLALFDYLRKSRSGGFVVSLSGGADSSAVSCLVAIMVRLALAELGRDTLVARLPSVARIAEAYTAGQLTRGLLTCVYQSTRQSSTTTLEAARTLAGEIEAEFIELDVDPLVRGYIERIEAAIGRPLEWSRDDIPLQNIQARVRAPSVWLLANLRQALLLATSNRSEAAVGYATMDGDTSGSISPLAGIDKAYLRCWLRWLETEGPIGVGPIPALHLVNRQAPTAELRPPSAKQTDEDDLMPYDVLDAAERAAIRDKLAPVDVFRRLRGEFPRHTIRDLGIWVERFFRLWSRNQWKRERYAPSFHLDDQNLDPKTWCRFPILSGGFERELGELRQYVAALIDAEP